MRFLTQLLICVFISVSTVNFAQIPDFLQASHEFSNQGYTQFAYHNQYLYAFRPCEGIAVFELDVNNRLTEVNFIERPGDKIDEMRIHGQRLFCNTVSNSRRYYQWFDLSDPSAPQFENQTPALVSPNVWGLGEDTLYIQGPHSAQRQIHRYDLSQEPLIGEPFDLINSEATGYDELIVLGDRIFLLESFEVAEAGFDEKNQLVISQRISLSFNLARGWALMDNGQVLLVLAGQNLVVYDISQPGRIIERSKTPCAMATTRVDLLVDRDMLLVVGDQEIKQFSLANPSRPQEVSTEFAPCDACILDRAQDRLLGLSYNQITVQDYGNGVTQDSQILRATHGIFSAIAWRDDVVVGYSEGMLYFLDWSDPEAPQITHTRNIGGEDVDLSFADNNLFVQVFSNENEAARQLWVFSASRPDRINELGRYPFEDSHQNGEYLAALEDGTISVFTMIPLNLREPESVLVLPEAPIHQEYRNIYLKDDYLIAATGRIISLFEKERGRWSELTTFSESARDFLWLENSLIAAGSTLKSFDMTNPRSPAVIESIPYSPILQNKGRIRGHYGDVLFMARPIGLYRVDISDPRRPQLNFQSRFRLHGVPAIQGDEAIFGLECPVGMGRTSLIDCGSPALEPIAPILYACEGDITTVNSGVTGDDLTLTWLRNGELLPNEQNARLTISVEAGPPVIYTCLVQGRCDYAEQVEIEVIAGVCNTVFAYSRWQTSLYYCDRQNPTVLDFVAGLNNGGTCP